jgi:hypothetical protein
MRLSELAAQRPETHVWVARHPNAYDGLLTWLHDYGTADVKAAVEDRLASATRADNQAEAPAGAGAPAPATSSDLETEARTHESAQLAPAMTTSLIPHRPLVSHKKYTTAILLTLFFGGYGVDRFYLGRIATGILKLLTLGFFGLWTMIDSIRIANGSLRSIDELELEGFRKYKGPVQIVVWILAVIYFLSIGIAISFVIWAFSAANTALGAYTTSYSDSSEDYGGSGSTAVDDDTHPDIDGGYSSEGGERYGVETGVLDDDPHESSGDEDGGRPTVIEDGAGPDDRLLAEASKYCPNGYDAHAYGETQSAFFAICSDGYDVVYYGESYRIGAGITLPAYETAAGYEASNFEDGVTTIYSVTADSLVITNQDTGENLLDEYVITWAAAASVDD